MKKKILVIVSKIDKDFRHLYSLVDINEYKLHQNEIISFYKDKKEKLKYIEKENHHYFLKILQDYYGKENFFIFNQEVDNRMQEMGIEATNIHGNINEMKENNIDFNIILKNEDGKYEELIKKIDETHLLIFIGNIGGADPSLFIEEMSNSIYINNEEELQSIADNITVSSFFDEVIIDDINKTEVSDKLFKRIKEIISIEPFKINKEKPFLDETFFIKNKIEEYIIDLKKKYDISDVKTKLGNKIKRYYPFLKTYPDIFVENIWYAFCTDTDNIKNMDNPYETDLFYDLFLVYVLYKWNGIKKTIYNSPKISLTEAFINYNLKDINIFKNMIFKNENSLIRSN